MKLFRICFFLSFVLVSAQERNLTRGRTKSDQMVIASAMGPIKVELKDIKIRFLRHGSEQEPGSVWVVYDLGNEI